MFTSKSSLRTAGPTILVAIVLFGACITAAVSLLGEQAETAQMLRENVSSRMAAQNLETTLENLVALLRHGSSDVDGLHDQLEELLIEASELADKEEERRLLDDLKESLDRYSRTWGQPHRLGAGLKPAEIEAAIHTLETETLPRCRKLRTFNGAQIRESEELHARTVRWMAWGLIGVGLVGSLGGILLGYNMARSLRRSIHQMSVRIQDASSRLGQNLPTVTLAWDGDLHQLHGQMERLMQDIERVVQRLQQREREVLRAEQLKMVGQLAAGAAHELRNPLTAIKMLLQTLREEANERNLPADDLDVIEREVRRMERCLHTFLDFARLPRPERRPVNLASIVDRTLVLLGGRARRQRVAIQFTEPPSSVVVEADHEQVQQVLLNLILNALDAMPEGGSLEVRLKSPKNGFAVVCVRDTGPGISSELMPRLFEPFVSSKETGLGLGLVVSQRIAEAHGGSLQAANRPEGGACFELRLPVGTLVPDSTLQPAIGKGVS